MRVMASRRTTATQMPGSPASSTIRRWTAVRLAATAASPSQAPENPARSAGLNAPIAGAG